jgi:UDP-N-acetylmuramate-alanine ligase
MQWNIVFVWAGGSWLSNLVWILWDLGFHNLIWIDEQDSQITQQLQTKWIQIFKHWKYQIKPDDAVIYSAATKWSPEVLKAFELKKSEHKSLLIWDYFQFLGEMTKYFKSIGFTGTNGKSSSSAMW